MKNNKNNKRKMAVAVLAGLALTGIIGASAASLGGINSESLGADSNDVLSCDTDGVDVSYTTVYNPAATTANPAGTYDVQTVDISDVNTDCEGLAFEVLLLDSTNTPIATDSGFVALSNPADASGSSDFPVTVTPGAVAAELVEGIAITISGTIVTAP